MCLACYRCASNGRNYPYFQTLKILHIYSEYEVVLEKGAKIKDTKGKNGTTLVRAGCRNNNLAHFLCEPLVCKKRGNQKGRWRKRKGDLLK